MVTASQDDAIFELEAAELGYSLLTGNSAMKPGLGDQWFGRPFQLSQLTHGPWTHIKPVLPLKTLNLRDSPTHPGETVKALHSLKIFNKGLVPPAR